MSYALPFATPAALENETKRTHFVPKPLARTKFAGSATPAHRAMLLDRRLLNI
jgi:hypothetical protein